MTKQIYPIIKRVFCPKCGKITTHILYDEKLKIYKCLICKNVHAQYEENK